MPYQSLLTISNLSVSLSLARPQMCPVNVYDTIMMQCWDFAPKNRPTFTQILQKLDICIAEIDRVN